MTSNKNYANSNISQQKILVIDDDIDMAESIKYTLEKNNPSIDCSIVNDPYEALLSLADNIYDMVMLDQKMPGLLGTSVIQKIDEFIGTDPLIVESGIYDNKKVPVVLMSGTDSFSQYSFDDLKNFKVVDKINKKELPTFLNNQAS